ncbi:MAG: cation transport protein-domain-containing protein [Benjaminiella poitrasii]|nr:MAG: cation transport protein-domain-containing protein [Benjaminiella poitrasii]
MSLKENLHRLNKLLYQFWDTRIHFLELHYIYILLLIFISSGLYYCLPGTNWSYIDALFMATTGATDTGLNTIPMSEMKTYHMVILYISSFLGSHVTVSFVVVMVRRYYFSKRFEEVLKYNQKRKEEYRRLKVLREIQASQEEERRKQLQRMEASDATSSTTVMNKSNQRSTTASLISGPIRRRMSLLSIRSTPAQNSKRLSLFIPGRRRRSSLDVEQHSVSQHPNFNSDNEDQDNNFSAIQMNENDASELNSKEESVGHGLDIELSSSTHPCDTSLYNASNTNNNNNSNSMDDPTVTSSSSSLYDSYPSSANNNDSNQQQQQDNRAIIFVESPKEMPSQSNNQQITFSEDTNILRERERRRFQQNRQEESGYTGLHRTNSEYEIMSQPSAKSQLTRNERYRIGGTEYRALDMLARLVPIYYLGFIILFGFFFRIYVAASSYAREVLDTSNSTGPVDYWFFSFFLSLSAFTNLGLNHLDASMAPFQNAPAPLILCIILILVGNTAFAILLRFIIWVCYRLTPERKVMRRETFRYLLDHPRRCYTTLFPSTQTWWLLIVLVAITLIELICFLALNYWLPVLRGISWGSRFLDGLFQSVATRNAGFSVVSLSELNPGAQLVYIVAMYISVYPVAISMRNSNIYQSSGYF